MSTRVEDIFNHLKNDNIEVYFPEQHIGEVKSKYVVVRQQGENQFNDYSSIVASIDLYLYVPRNNYSELQDFIDKIKESMKKMKPMIKFTDYVSPSYYDDQIKGHTVTMTYEYYRKK